MTSDGYSWTEEIEIGAVIPWSDQADTEAAWKSVGGPKWRKTPPCALTNPAYPVNFLPDRSGHAYGILKIIDNKPAFPPGAIKLGFQAPDSAEASIGWGYGECYSMYDRQNFLSPNVAGNYVTWGPTPIDIEIGDYITPNHPDGDTSLLGPFALAVNGTVPFTLEPYKP